MEDWYEYKQRMEEQQKFLEIEAAHKLTVEMEAEAAKYTKLASLAKQNEIQTMRDVLRGRWMYLTFRVKSAQKWLSMRDGKLDGRKNYEEKESFEYLTHQIEELLDIKIDITEISVLGYDEAAFYVKFKTSEDHFGREFELTIPETERLSKDNLNELDYGKLRLSVRDNEHSCCWNFICASYDKEELKNKFKEWLTPKPV